MKWINDLQTCHGQSPNLDLVPPTMRPSPRMGRTPQSANQIDIFYFGFENFSSL
jgi:hypothetical protein